MVLKASSSYRIVRSSKQTSPLKIDKSGTELASPETHGPVDNLFTALEQASDFSFSVLQESFRTVDFIVTVEALSW